MKEEDDDDDDTTTTMTCSLALAQPNLSVLGSHVIISAW